MKFLTVFVAVLALAAGAYNPISTWTLQEIDQALSNPDTDPAQIPYLVEGLNTIMVNLMAGDHQATVVLSLPLTATVTIEEVTNALHDPTTDPAVIPYLETALNDLMQAYIAGEAEPTTTLSIPAMNVNMWTLQQLSYAIEDPATDPELLIYVEHALNMYMEQIFAGNDVTSIAVVTPPGVFAEVPTLPESVMPIAPEPVVPIEPTPVVPVEPTPVVPVEPTPVLPPTPVFPINPTPVVPIVPEQVTPVVPVTPVATAPLVQLIVNVNTNQAAAPAPEAVSPIAPSPVIVEGYEPTPIAVLPEPIIAVGPWA